MLNTTSLLLVTLLAPPDLPARTSAGARAAWEEFTSATRPAEASPITALEFEVQVLTRTDSRSNEGEFSLAYLQPDRLRMRMKSGREQGLGSGIGQRAYWLRDGDEVLRLVGREYDTDRRQIDDLVSLCQNLCALANPDGLRVTEVELLRKGPRGLGSGKHAAKSLTWLSFTSPDFRLTGSETSEMQVELGLDPETGVAQQAVVRDPKGDAPPRHLIFERQDSIDGFRIPRTIHVFDANDAEEPGRGFRSRATVEIYLLAGTVRAEFGPEAFDPEG